MIDSGLPAAQERFTRPRAFLRALSLLYKDLKRENLIRIMLGIGALVIACSSSPGSRSPPSSPARSRAYSWRGRSGRVRVCRPELRSMELSVKEREELSRIAKPLEVSRGSVIMREGEIGNTMYFFAHGVVEVTQRLTLRTGRRGLGQAEKSVVKLEAENAPFFGDMAMFENEPRSATITASTACLLYEVSRADFQDFCSRNPAMGVKLVRGIAAVLCQRLRRTNRDVLKLTTALSLALSR